MNRNGFRWSVPMVLMLACFLQGCQSKPKRAVIGIALSVHNHDAVELAARDVNAAGGIDGVPLELVGLEWKFREAVHPTEILEWAERFAATDDLIAVVGHSDSASTLSAAAFYNKQKIPQIVTIATSPAITRVGNWTYRLCLSDAKQGPALARYAHEQWGKQRIATFYVNDDYGRGVAQQFEEEFRRLGGSILTSVMHRNTLKPDDQQLIEYTIERLENENAPDLYVLFQREDAARWTIETIRKTGTRADILGGDTLGAPEFIQGYPEAVEGIRFSQFFVPDPSRPRTSSFVREYQALTGEAPGYGQAFAYDAVFLLAEAARESGFTREGVKSYLDGLIAERRTVDGVGGPFTIGADHDGRRDLYIAEARGGGWEVLARLPVD
jgi:branched-chain amino acid transport system substrate-binding protein